jgi:four helix bundle protein
MRDHTKLTAFKLTHEFAVNIYKLTMNFSKEKVYGLCSQMRRTAVSISSNIVEGYASVSQSKYVRFLEIAFDSLLELHYQSTMTVRLDYAKEPDAKEFEIKFIEIVKVPGVLIRCFHTPKSL